MIQYLNLLSTLLGAPSRGDRTGVGTQGVFGYQMRFNLWEGFPLLTTKKVHFKSIVHELLWFLSGYTNIQYLKDNGVSIWDEWADSNGDLGPVYGAQWRSWQGVSGGQVEVVDQISELISGLKKDPFSRRHIVTAWNPAEIPSMALPPCHCLFQFYVRQSTLLERMTAFYECRDFAPRSPSDWHKELELLDSNGVPSLSVDCQLYQRSADTFLGVPFNIASYALLTHMVADVVGMLPGTFVWTGGDVHLYSNHVHQAQEQLSRTTRDLPTLRLAHKDSIFDFKYEDVVLEGYDPHPAIPAPVAR